MSFQRQPIYPRSGKRVPQPIDRVLSVEELNKILVPQMRRILAKLLKADPELVVQAHRNSGGDKFGVKLSSTMLFRLSQVSDLRKEAEAARKELCRSGDSQARYDFHKFGSEADEISSERKTVWQWRLLLEEVLNGKREPPREKLAKLSKTRRGRSFQEVPKKIKKARRGRYSVVNLKAAPFSNI